LTTNHNSFTANGLWPKYLLSDIDNPCPVVLQFKAPKQVGPFPQIYATWKGFTMYPPLRPYSKVPTRSEIVTTRPLDEPVLQLELSFIEEAKAAPLGWILDPEKPVRIVDHVIAYLLLQEAHESNLHIKADLRQAQICLILASRGNTDPFVASSYVMYGTHPDKVYPKMRANRMARLGEEYEIWYDAAGNLRPDVPKKPAVTSSGADAQRSATRFLGSGVETPFDSASRRGPDSAPDSVLSPEEAAERSTSERLAALIQIPTKEAV
jgi:hypothetical protein